MKKQSIFCWFVLLFIALGLIFHLQFQEAGRVRLSSAPPPQLTVEEIAEIEFYAQDVSDAAVYSTADTVAKIEIQSTENGRIRCQVTARSPGSASLSCKANGRQSPAFAISVVEAPEPVLTSGKEISLVSIIFWKAIRRNWQKQSNSAKALRIYLGGMFLMGAQIACQMAFVSIGNAPC